MNYVLVSGAFATSSLPFSTTRAPSNANKVGRVMGCTLSIAIVLGLHYHFGFRDYQFADLETPAYSKPA